MEIKFTIEGFVSRIAKIAIAKDMPVLVGLGDDEDPSQSSVKTWRIDPTLDFPLLIDNIPLIKGVVVRFLHEVEHTLHFHERDLHLTDGRTLTC